MALRDFPAGQNPSAGTVNVEKFADTDNVTERLNFPLDSNGQPMLTGDGSGLTNIPAGTVAWNFFNAFLPISNSNLIGLQTGNGLIAFINNSIAPVDGDLIGATNAMAWTATNAYYTNNGGVNWYTSY